MLNFSHGQSFAAHLVVVLDVSGRVPVYKHHGIFSEASPTMMRGELAIEVRKARGATYQAARDALVRELAADPHYRWAAAASSTGPRR